MLRAWFLRESPFMIKFEKNYEYSVSCQMMLYYVEKDQN
jgi:hypothetical protein